MMPMDFLQLAGKRVLVFGVANRKSVACHVGRVLTEAGAECVYVVQNEAVRESAAKLLAGRDVYVCDVEREDQIARLRDEVGARHDRFHGLVHSIAFADYSEGVRPFHETSKSAFLRAVDVSCYSLVALSRALADLMDPDASVVTISISTTRMAAENYGYMAPVKAALDSAIGFLAKSFSRFSQIRFNAVAPGLVRTPLTRGLVSTELAEKASLVMHPLGRLGEPGDVARAIAFLIDPAQDWITGQVLGVDGGLADVKARA